MKLDRRNLLAGGAALATVPHFGREAFAQTRAETLRYVTGAAVNTLDPTMPGSTREAFGIDSAPFLSLLDLRDEKIKPKTLQPASIYEQYLKEIQKVVDAVDKLTK